jgi:hypothetical protein
MVPSSMVADLANVIRDRSGGVPWLAAGHNLRDPARRRDIVSEAIRQTIDKDALLMCKNSHQSTNLVILMCKR